jgi:hypothetical protein
MRNTLININNLSFSGAKFKSIFMFSLLVALSGCLSAEWQAARSECERRGYELYPQELYQVNYNSVLFNFQDDDVAFSFSRNAVLQYNENQYKDNLTSILSFYAYFILGMDYDSFSLKGGTPYFTKAQQIVTNAQVSGAAGWKANETGKRNRYWLVENILQPAFEPVRDCNYMYHRKGIDMLYENKVAGKKAMYDALNKLTPVVQRNPNNLNTLNFLYSKIQEFKNVLSDSETKEKTDFVNLLKKLDSGNSSLYQEILN